MTTKQPATPLLPFRTTLMEGGKRLALVNKAGGLLTYLDCNEDRAAYIVHACNAYQELVAALRDVLPDLIYGTTDRWKGDGSKPLSDLLRSLGEDA